MYGCHLRTMDKNQKAGKEQIIKQITEINEMVNDEVIDKYEAARLKDQIDPEGLGRQLD